MSKAQSYVTRPGPNFEKYGMAVCHSLQQQGESLTDANIEAEAEDLAELLVLDEQSLTARAKELAHEMEADGGEIIGNIYEEADT